MCWLDECISGTLGCSAAGRRCKEGGCAVSKAVVAHEHESIGWLVPVLGARWFRQQLKWVGRGWGGYKGGGWPCWLGSSTPRPRCNQVGVKHAMCGADLVRVCALPHARMCATVLHRRAISGPKWAATCAGAAQQRCGPPGVSSSTASLSAIAQRRRRNSRPHPYPTRYATGAPTRAYPKRYAAGAPPGDTRPA